MLKINSLKQLLLIAFLFISHLAFGQKKHYVLVLSKTENQLFVLDYNTLNTVAKVTVGDGPHEIVTNDDGSKAYISIPKMMANGHEIDVINLHTLKLEKVIDTQPFLIPHGLVYQHQKLWFTAQGSKVVGVYNTKTNKVEQVFGTGQDFTHLLYVTPDENRFYTTNVESGTVSIYEKEELPPYMPPTGVLPPNAKPRVEWRQSLVNVGSGAEGFDVTPDGKELWTALPNGHIAVVDLYTKREKTNINSNVLGLHRLKIAPDGKTACVVSVKTGDLLFYNTQTYDLEKTMNIGKGAGIYMDKESNRMFISCTPDNYVVVIDMASQKVIKKLPIGRPDGIIAVLVN